MFSQDTVVAPFVQREGRKEGRGKGCVTGITGWRIWGLFMFSLGCKWDGISVTASSFPTRVSGIFVSEPTRKVAPEKGRKRELCLSAVETGPEFLMYTEWCAHIRTVTDKIYAVGGLIHIKCLAN